MNIHHAMLGLLGMEPLTGYDIKKIMQNSPLFHWSGNNSQIYRALSDLLLKGYVAGEVVRGDASPTKKRYALTETGRQALEDLSKAFPELPEIKKPILTQLLFGQDLSRQEMETILDQYEREIRGLLLLKDENGFIKSAPPLAMAIWEASAQSLRAFYEGELAWIERIRQKALPLAKSPVIHPESERKSMHCATIHQKGQTYVTVTDGQILTEQDGLDLVSACMEHGTNRVLLPAACLSDHFLRLSTRLAGLVLQKLVNYNIRAAAVLDTQKTSERFQEFSLEANKGHAFRLFATAAEAEAWLLAE